ncbi:UDP-N-acetylmuramate--L-alanine ligase [Heliobacterium gestii]|uniref:UDP-N-acetylmuramate--L-alanine ligase n=1 Tax=Heliomicrobium gestii TaxID=2699 RepID=A0A845LEE1_HELGE|nr:UDP-N-acetylmuramate--L-alanine ligase [Heliomicrobium gestii]MZP43931.1 UDP-N-acetylmuramate--L-alanine ligase [Heliomicrobium gestii]
MLAKGTWLHFIGVGGTGMSGLARVMLQQGYRVSGSDLADTAVTQRLVRQGATVFQGHREEHLQPGVDVVVVSTAVKADNPELRLAKARKLTIWHRADLLAWLMEQKKGIAVAGAHGKTTTSAMIGLMLEQCELDPAIVVGGEIREIEGNAKWGQGDYMAAEADESDSSFLKLSPWMAVITNIEADHLDHYHSFDAIVKAFYRFTERVSSDGFLLLCADDPHLQEMAQRVTSPRVITYGMTGKADYRATDLIGTPEGSQADIFHGEQRLGRLSLSVPGEHNISNALAAVACADLIGIPFDQAAAALSRFQGAGRRFQRMGDAGGIRVVDDYAHHPTEVKATLAAARQTQPKRLVAVFQPHRFTRTRDLYRQFGEAFDAADVVIFNEIYPAGEAPIPGVSAGLIMDVYENRCGRKALYAADREELLRCLLNAVQPGDLVMTMGAGNIWMAGCQLLEALEKGAEQQG